MHVAGGVRRADVEQLDADAVEVELEPVVDQRRRRRQLDAGEVPVGERAGECGHGGIGAVARRRAAPASSAGSRAELLGAQAVADDLGVGEELVAPAVVAVVVRVDDAPRRARPDARVVLDHLARVRQVPERVDDQAAAAVDEAGVARAEPAILLQAGVDVGASSTSSMAEPVPPALLRWQRLRRS